MMGSEQQLPMESSIYSYEVFSINLSFVSIFLYTSIPPPDTTHLTLSYTSGMLSVAWRYSIGRMALNHLGISLIYAGILRREFSSLMPELVYGGHGETQNQGHNI